MRSEHNRGASLAAFLLAVSTVTLLMVSPVEGQGPCTSDADCPDTLPVCTNGQCGECVVSAFPGAAGSCPDIPVGEVFAGPQTCGRTISTDPIRTFCVGCASIQEDGITSAADCETVLAAPPFNQEADVVANCQRGCFEYYACTSDADCQDVPSPLAQACTSGVCTDIDECATNADCPANRPLCESGQCLAKCGTNADCPADRPLCDAGQCVVSSVPSSPTFDPLYGMGGGSSA